MSKDCKSILVEITSTVDDKLHQVGFKTDELNEDAKPILHKEDPRTKVFIATKMACPKVELSTLKIIIKNNFGFIITFNIPTITYHNTTLNNTFHEFRRIKKNSSTAERKIHQ